MASYGKRHDIAKQFQKRLEESTISDHGYRILGAEVSELLDDDERIEATILVDGEWLSGVREKKLWIFSNARLIIARPHSIVAYVLYSDLYSVDYSDKLFSRNSGKITIQLAERSYFRAGRGSNITSLRLDELALAPKVEKRILGEGLDKNQGRKLAKILRNIVDETTAVEQYETQPWLAQPSSSFEAKVEAVPYFEMPMHDGDVAFCSDDGCDCGRPGARIRRGDGYLYVSDEVVDDRRDCPTVVQWERKLELMRRKLGAQLNDPSVNLYYTVVPELCCERSARRRGLNLEVAAADAKRWWATGKVPLRPTPKK